MKTLVMAVSATTLLIACAGTGYRAQNRYEGERPTHEVAVLRVGQKGDLRKDVVMAYRGLDILRVDGTSARRHDYGLDYVNEIWLLPGKHSVGLRYSRNAAHAQADLWFVAEAGKSYVGKYEQRGMRVRIWLEEADTGRRVGGVAGSPNEPGDEGVPLSGVAK